MNGLGRILAGETNISDLLAYFTEKDPQPWVEIVGAAPATVEREGHARTANRADLLLRDGAGEVLSATEVKLGHHLSEEQAQWYESTFPEVPLVLASIDRDPGTVGSAEGRWVKVQLPELVRRWEGSVDDEVATFARAAGRILEEWAELIAGVAQTGTAQPAQPLAVIIEPFLGRVLTRALEGVFEESTGDVAYSGVTSGGGNAILQAWRAFPHRDGRQYATAEVRWKPAAKIMDFRFGIDVTRDGRAERAATWELAKMLDSVIRADAFIDHLREVDLKRAELFPSRVGSGRPSPKGDWEEVVKHGFQRGDASRYNPGFYRDGDTRFEASVRLDTATATGPDVVALLDHALSFLTAALEKSGV